jgi:hypothetical protein
MKVTLTQEGGFAAFTRQPLVLDTAALADADRAELARLIDAASLAPAPVPSGRVRDAITYTLTAHGLELSQSDGAMSEAFSRLVAFMRQKA